MIPATTTIADSTDSATPVKSSPTMLPTARITAVTRTGSFRMRSQMARMMVSFLARRISPEINDLFDRQPLQEGAGVVDEMVGDVLVPHHRVRLFDLPLPHLVDALLVGRSEEHTSELLSRENLVCRLLLEIKKKFDR